MTPEEMNKAIAEHLGTKAPYAECPKHGDILEMFCPEIDGPECPHCGREVEIGGDDYHGDLNACHEMENAEFFAKGIPASRWENYDNHLHDVTGGFGRAHATAAQRTEAFLRTVGKWTE